MREATTKVLSLAKQRDEARKALAEERQRIESELEVKVKLLEEENASLHAQIRQAAGTETNDKTPGTVTLFPLVEILSFLSSFRDNSKRPPLLDDKIYTSQALYDNFPLAKPTQFGIIQ